MNVVVSLVLQLLFLSQTLKNFLLGYFGDAATCQWGTVAVIVWAGEGSNLRRWGELMLWSSQHYNTNQGRVAPDWNVNMPAHDKGTLISVYTLLY